MNLNMAIAFKKNISKFLFNEYKVVALLWYHQKLLSGMALSLCVSVRRQYRTRQCMIEGISESGHMIATPWNRLALVVFFHYKAIQET